MILLIGDIQGCRDAFDRLLETCGFSPSRDRLVALGDLVNRGPASLQVLRRLRELEGSARCLLGNHDLHLLATAHGVRPPHRSDTLDEILHAPDRAGCIEWLCTQPLALQESGWLCVHAGVDPAWNATQTLTLAQEVQSLLRGPDLDEFLHRMYGSEPTRWDDALQGIPRARHIVDALTRIRFCAPDGTLDLVTKEGADAAPPGHRPWFDMPGRRTAGTPIAFGHWSTLGLIDRPDLLGLDTGCVWGRELTAARVDGGRREIVQVRCDRAAG